MKFDFFKKKNEGHITGKRIEITKADVNRLAQYAGSIINMFVHVYPDKTQRLKYVSALAGYACHQAVIANGEVFAKVETDEGLEFYFGDAVNYYLMENQFSVLGFMQGFYENKNDTAKKIDAVSGIKTAVSVIGDNTYRIWGKHEPGQLFKETKACWDGIYNNMTGAFCKNPSEWPVLYGIVLQNIMFQSEMNAEETFYKALECMLYISKMDVKSIK
jgi:hypothetical protein